MRMDFVQRAPHHNRRKKKIIGGVVWSREKGKERLKSVFED